MHYYLGLDCSTQSLKALLIDAEAGTIHASAMVSFGRDLPQFKALDGVLAHPDPLIKHSPPTLWLAALDLVLARLVEQNAPLGLVRGLCGAGQQHGTVYLNNSAGEVLAGLHPSQPLAAQLAPCFARATSPIWMDSSTTAECHSIETAVGPRLLQDSGSPATERFAGPQICKFHRTESPAYDRTAMIHLVSSFMCSVLIGKHAPIDRGDGAGMNLLNLKSNDWDEAMLEATAPGLRAKLPPIVPSTHIAGGLHPYFAKYGFIPGTPVTVWTGDNPASLIGSGACQPGTAVISLGTSDTFFAALPEMKTDPCGYGHVFGNPAGGCMSLICFKNGSLARERIKEECHVNWDDFSQALTVTPPGNGGNMALSYYIPEITPKVLEAGVRRRGNAVFCAGMADPAVNIRAALEGQFCSMRVMSGWIGDFQTLRLTGGASQNRGIVQLIADIFQAKIEMIAIPDSAALGSAMLAAWSCGGVSLSQLSAQFSAAKAVIQPDTKLRNAYQDCTLKYQQFLHEVSD